MKKLNKKGFTLVELLAVIVILALLMVVATRSIGNVLDNSKKSALQTEAQKVLSGMYQEVQSQKLVGTPALGAAGTSNAGCLGSYCSTDGDYYVKATISKVDGSMTGAIVQYTTTYYVLANVDANGQIRYCSSATTVGTCDSGKYDSNTAISLSGKALEKTAAALTLN